ncbi:MAG: Ig-like domain-containing protein [Niabella sp.]
MMNRFLVITVFLLSTWSCKQEVNSFPSAPLTGITISQETMLLGVGKAAQVNAQRLPSDATGTPFDWISDNQSVATVSANGTVTGGQKEP